MTRAFSPCDWSGWPSIRQVISLMLWLDQDNGPRSIAGLTCPRGLLAGSGGRDCHGTVEFAMEAVARSGRVIGVVNPRMPWVPTAPTLGYADFAMVAEAEFPLRTYEIGEPDTQSVAIAALIAAYITDAAALQVGLGKVPAAVLRLLEGRRGLRLRSGMLSDGVIALAEGGMLDPGWRHETCVLVGSERL